MGQNTKSGSNTPKIDAFDFARLVHRWSGQLVARKRGMIRKSFGERGATSGSTIDKTLFVWDNHGCMPLRPADETFLPQLERYRSAGVDVVTLNVAWDGMPPGIAIPMLATFRRWITQRPDGYILIETVDDLDIAYTTGRLGVLFDIEGGCALLDQLAMVQLYYDLGVRWMLMAYNVRNAVGGGCLDAEDGGLTDFGRVVVDEMCRVGMVPCCTHTGHRTAMEVMERSTLPVIFSHSNASSVWDHPRNLPDGLMRACAATGGVVGLNGNALFLGRDGPRVETAVDHVRYVADLIGVEHVALGLDYVFDENEIAEARQTASTFLPASAGYADALQQIEPERLPAIAEGLLRHGWSDSALAAFLGGNLKRVARRAWKPATHQRGA